MTFSFTLTKKTGNLMVREAPVPQDVLFLIGNIQLLPNLATITCYDLNWKFISSSTMQLHILYLYLDIFKQISVSSPDK